MARTRRPLRFAVSTALLVAPVASAGCTSTADKRVNEGPVEEPKQPPEPPTVNEGPVPPPADEGGEPLEPTTAADPPRPIEERVNPGPEPEPPPEPEPLPKKAPEKRVNTGPQKDAVPLTTDKGDAK